MKWPFVSQREFARSLERIDKLVNRIDELDKKYKELYTETRHIARRIRETRSLAVDRDRLYQILARDEKLESERNK